jgi:hypothetical protein
MQNRVAAYDAGLILCRNAENVSRVLMGGSDVQSSIFLRRKVPKRVTGPLELGWRFVVLSIRYLPPVSSIARPKHPYMFLPVPPPPAPNPSPVCPRTNRNRFYDRAVWVDSTHSGKRTVRASRFSSLHASLRTIHTCLSIFFKTCKPTQCLSIFLIRTCMEYCGDPRLPVHILKSSGQIIPLSEIPLYCFSAVATMSTDAKYTEVRIYLIILAFPDRQ